MALSDGHVNISTQSIADILGHERKTGLVFVIKTSIGIAEFDGHPDYQRMIDRADKARYAAKHAGRNRWIRAQAKFCP